MVYQLEVGFVHQCGSVQRAAGAKTIESAVGDPVQLVVDGREEQVHGIAVAAAQGAKHLRDLRLILHQDRDLGRRQLLLAILHTRHGQTSARTFSWQKWQRSGPQPG